MGDVCACEIHRSGRGIQPCAYHARRAGEHRHMYDVLDRIARGAIGDEHPAVYAAQALERVSFWHDRIAAPNQKERRDA